MDDVFPPRPLMRDPVAALIATVCTPAFPDAVVAHLRQSADIANFGAFYVADMAQPAPVLSIWGGRMSSYWFNRNARTILSNDGLVQDTLRRIGAARQGKLSIERFRPGPEDPTAQIYARDRVIERVTVSSRVGRTGIMSFFLRGQEAGWITDEEMTRLERVLPIVHDLIGVRHAVAGSAVVGQSALSRVTALRHRSVGAFARLSPREAEVCDKLVQGVSVSGSALALQVSENTVRTLRRRAYEKLGVHSATQISALLLAVEDGKSA